MKRGSLTIGAPVLALASQAEAEAGTNNTKAMTPLRVAEAIAALGGGGGSSPNSQLCWVNADTGNDSTSDGTINSPYATIQAAWDSLSATPYTFIVLGAVGPLDIRGRPNPLISLIGYGAECSYLDSVLADGGFRMTGNGRDLIAVAEIAGQAADGPNGFNYEAEGSGGDGQSGSNFENFIVLKGIRINGQVMARGGDGGSGGSGGFNAGTSGGSGGLGGQGGNGGVIVVHDCHVDGTVLSTGGDGGDGGRGGPSIDLDGEHGAVAGGSGGNGGNGGAAGDIYIRDSRIANTVTSGFSSGGSAGPGGSGATDGTGGSDGAPGGTGAIDVEFSSIQNVPVEYNSISVRASLMGGAFVPN